MRINLKKISPDLIWPFLIIASVFIASGQSEIASPGFSFSIDKVAHFAVFGALATSVIRIPRFKKAGWKGALTVCLIVAVYGGLDEFRQSFTPWRSVEFDDWLADILGAAVAVILYQGIPPYRALLESQPLKFFRRRSSLKA